jgi:hypothetical protein
MITIDVYVLDPNTFGNAAGDDICVSRKIGTTHPF